ncbi:hypothetical protein HK096_010011, partial [Nowakowskiella sp. JEL0078]
MVSKSILALALLAATASAQTCSTLYGQCGGQYYTLWSHLLYKFRLQFPKSMCLPGSASSSTTTTTTTTTTTKPATTTTTTTTTKPATTTTTTTTTTPTTKPASTTTTTTKSSTTTTTTTTTSSAAPSSTVSPVGVPAGGPAYSAPSGSYSSSGNPYEGVPRYVSGVYSAKVDSSIATFTSNATRVAEFNQLKKYPTYTWLDTISAISTLKGHLDAASAQGAGGQIVAEFVIYDLPGRDCAALASNGEIAAGGIATYKSQYIDPIVTILNSKPSNVRVVLVIEPDSLPNLATNIGALRCNSVTQSEYPDGVAYAIAKLSVISNTYLYLDAGHGGWLGWPDNQQKI